LVTSASVGVTAAKECPTVLELYRCFLRYFGMEEVKDEKTFKGFVDRLTLGITRVLGEWTMFNKK